MSRMWEYIEGRSRERSGNDEVREAYEEGYDCGYEDGYAKAMNSSRDYFGERRRYGLGSQPSRSRSEEREDGTYMGERGRSRDSMGRYR